MQRIFVLLLACELTACVPTLEVPDDAQIACVADADCPGGFQCQSGSCLREGRNLTPTMSIGAIDRTVGMILIPVTIFDEESDGVRLTADFYLDGIGGPYAAAITPTDVTSSPEGTQMQVEWDAASDLLAQGHSGYVGPIIRLEITPSDNGGVGATADSGTFAYGNDPPTLSDVTLDDTVVRGYTIVRFRVSDTSSDLLHVSLFEFSELGDFSDALPVTLDDGVDSNFPGGRISLLGSSPVEQEQNITWDSTQIALLDAPGSRIRMQVADDFNAISPVVTSSAAFEVDNADSPPILTVTPLTDLTQPVTTSPTVTVRFTDADNRPARLIAQYSLDSAAWSPAATSDPTLSLAPDTDHPFTWQIFELGNAYFPSVSLEFTIDDGVYTDTVTIGPFEVDLRPTSPPQATVEPVVPITGGRYLDLVTISYTVDDPDADTVNVAMGYSPDGINWYAAIQSGTDPTTNLTNGTKTFTWNALQNAIAGDGLGVETVITSPGAVPSTQDVVGAVSTVVFRIVPTDSSGAIGAPGDSLPFALGNAAPVAAITNVVGDSDELSVELQLSDALLDPAEIELQFRVNDVAIDPSTEWRPVKIVLGETTQLGTTSSGTTYVVVWDSLAPLLADPTLPDQGVGQTSPSDVELRIRGVDRPADLTTHYSPWVVWPFSQAIINQTQVRVEPLYAKLDGALRNGAIPIVYRLIDEQSDPADVRVEYSIDNQVSWARAAEYPSPLSEGVVSLATAPASSSGGGMLHTFLWDAHANLFITHQSVELRIIASDGLSPPGLGAQVIQPSVIGSGSTASPFTILILGTGGPTNRFVDAADINGDGMLDLVSVEYISNNIAVLLAEDLDLDGLPDGTFEPPILSGAGTNPVAAAVAFLDGDSTLDIVVCNQVGEINVLLGAGDGNFSPAAGSPYPTAGTCQDVLVADLDEDGLPDIVVVSSVLAQDIALWFGEDLDTNLLPDGTFQSGGSQSSGIGVRAVVAGDFNSDGVVDLAFGGRTPLILLGDDIDSDGRGDRTFTPGPSTFWVGNGADDIIVADFNGDGIDDLAQSHSLDDFVGVMLGNGTDGVGDATFTLRIIPAETSGTSALATGDVNGDGILDLVTTSGNMTILLGVGDGSFGTPALFPTGGGFDVTIADLDGDHLVEIAVSRSNGIDVYFPQEVPELGSQVGAPLVIPTGSDLNAVAGVDLDSDGVLDWIMAGESNTGGATALGLGVHGIGRGLFADFVAADIDTKAPDLAVGDFNADGVVDAVYAGDLTNKHKVVVALSLVSNGVGTGELSYSSEHASGESPHQITTCDLNNDAALDFAVLHIDFLTPFDGYSIGAFLGDTDGGGNPTGTFTEALDSPHVPVPLSRPWALACADLDLDGNMDLVFSTFVPSTGPGAIYWLEGQGDGSFVDPPALVAALADTAPSLIVDDFNADGVPDIAYSHDGPGGGVSILAGNGDGTAALVPGAPFNPSTRYTDLTAGDLNADGALDLIASARFSTNLTIFLGQTNGGFADGTMVELGSLTPDRPWASSMGDWNGDHVPDLVTYSRDNTLTIYNVRRPSHRNPWGRSLSRDQVFGGETFEYSRPTLLGEDILPALGMRRFAAAGDFGKDTFATLGDGARRSFVELVRRSGLPGTATGDLIPLTQAWVATGDITLANDIDPFAGTATRRRIEPRFGSAANPGLDLWAPLAAQRGIIIDLPIPSGRDDDSVTGGGGPVPTILVFMRTTDWVRASEHCGDPLWATVSPCIPANAPAGADDYLPRVPVTGTTPQEYRDVFIERYGWSEIPPDGNDDFTNGAETGPRFIVDLTPGKRRVRVLTDQLGVVQAFLRP